MHQLITFKPSFANLSLSASPAEGKGLEQEYHCICIYSSPGFFFIPLQQKKCGSFTRPQTLASEKRKSLKDLVCGWVGLRVGLLPCWLVTSAVWCNINVINLLLNNRMDFDGMQANCHKIQGSKIKGSHTSFIGNFKTWLFHKLCIDRMS